MTVKQFIAEIQVALGENVDDAILNEPWLLTLTGYAVNLVLEQEITRTLRRGDQIQAVRNVMRFENVPVIDDAVNNRRYVELPDKVYDLPGGRGIDFVAYYRANQQPGCSPLVARVQFDATTWRELALLYASKDPIRMPSPERPRYIPSDGNRLYLFGMDMMQKRVELGLIIAFDPMNGVDLNGELPISPESIFNVRRLVLSMANWILMQPQERLLNDGRDTDLGAPKPQAPPIMSVNDPILTAQSSAE